MEDRKETLNNNTYYDALTGLPNKSLFYDHLTQALSFAKRNNQIIADMFISVDSLKLINDTLGQGCGDQLLRIVSERLKGCLRKSDIVGRPGRDEFMILLPKITCAEDAAVVAKKIFTSMDIPFVYEKNELFISVSIGISIYPNDGDDAASLIKNSYTAMQRAKELEKNTYKFYSQAMNEEAFKRMMMVNSLRLAMRREEFLMHYQPQIDLNTGLICGMEALVRWQKPDFGVVYPGEFIHIMEESGLIIQLGEWVLRNACEQSKSWQKTGIRPLRMGVNLSACQFYQQDMVKMISRVLEETRLDPKCLEVELTESIFMRNIESTVEALKTLRSMGVHISIDDFGKGYSSLSYLKYFPVNKLKIVEPFVSSIAIDPDDAAITRAIVAMAHSLNMKVIAEGVEKEEHMDFLRSLKCDELQGNIFCRPLPAEDVIKVLAEEKHFLLMSS